jgi:hypothetical protein
MGVSQVMPDERLKLFAEEIYFLVHNSLVDVVPVFGMVDKLCCPFHRKGDVPCFISVGSKIGGTVLYRQYLGILSRTQEEAVCSQIDRAYVMDAYRWERRWKIHVAPCARCLSFPVNFWASDTVNCF